MKIVNRGFIFLKHRQAFWDWANQFNEDFTFNEDDKCEGTIYLIEDDFMENEVILEKSFKKIFYNELIAIADKEFFPNDLNLETFLIWFDIDFGTGVYDLQKTNILSETIE